MPINPSTLSKYDITQGDQAKTFVKQVADLFISLNTIIGTLVSTVTTAGIAALLNTFGVLSVTALITKSSNLGTVTTNQSVDCAGAFSASVMMAVSTAFNPTLTFTNLSSGAVVQVRFINSSGSARNFKIAASGFTVTGDLNGVATFDFTAGGVTFNSSTEINMIAVVLGTTFINFTGVVT